MNELKETPTEVREVIKTLLKAAFESNELSERQRVGFALEVFWGILVPKQSNDGGFFLQPKEVFDELPTLSAQLLNLYIGIFLGKGGEEQKSCGIEEIARLGAFSISNQLAAIQSMTESSGANKKSQTACLDMVMESLNKYISHNNPIPSERDDPSIDLKDPQDKKTIILH